MLDSLVGDAPPHYAFPLLGDLAAELHRRGHHVCIVTTSSAIVENWEYASERLQVIIIPDTRRPRAKALDRFREERRRIRDALTTFDADVINAHWLYEFSAAAATLAGPVCLVAHDHPLDVLRMFRMTYWWSRVSLGLCVRRREVFVGAVAPTVAAQVKTVFRARGSVELLPNWSPIQPDVALQSRLGSSSGRDVIVTILNGVGRLKNPTVALRAFQIVRRERPSVELAMFGRGYEPDNEFARMAARMDLSDGVTFVGLISHEALLEWLAQNATMLLHPARSEACSIALLEAMSLGIPVVGGERSGGVPWQLDNGAAGKLVDVEDPKSVAQGMLTLLADREMLNALGQAGKARSTSLFGKDSAVSRYEQWFTRAIESCTKL
jgi:glycosyltransferase involved in cell wall biosynthesis